MRKIRIKKDLCCNVEVLVGGEAVSLEGRRVTVMLCRPDRSKVKQQPLTIVDNRVGFKVHHQDQNDLGLYGIEVWLDKGSDQQTVVDIPEAFRLVPFTSMEDAENGTLEVVAVDMVASFEGAIAVVDSLESDNTTAALSAYQGKVLAGMITDLEASDTEGLELEAQERQEADEKLEAAVNELAENLDTAVESLTEKDTSLQEQLDAFTEITAEEVDQW
ncbi:MAG: hypothetical protein LUI09_05720 [Prevotellaceae bacterium]|nr:hypothetical protein [Prevotellaceae bacterium]